MIHYHVIYDITQTQFPQSMSELLMPFFMIILGAGIITLVWIKKRMDVRRNSLPGRVCITILMTAICLMYPVKNFIDYQRYMDLKAKLRASQCDVAEGRVTDLHPLISYKNSDSPGEIFAVNGTSFRYRDGSTQIGFHQTGIIHEGMQVRISYSAKYSPVDKDIARLEVAE